MEAKSRMQNDGAFTKQRAVADQRGTPVVALPLILSLGLLVLTGCGGTTQGNAAVKTRGIVHVDRKPVPGVAITLHPSDQQGVVATAMTGEDGSFEVSTYTQNDGAVPGTYVGTFVWGDYNAMTRSIEGDRLQGRYAKPELSKVEFTVTSGEYNDLGVIALSTH